MLSMYNAAMQYAKNAHRKQLRKYTKEPYICHPLAVAGLVYSVDHNEHMLCAAVLHDVVEDTNYTIKDIYNSFGPTVSEMVNELTDVSKTSDGNRKERKNMDLLHIKKARPASKTIKLADLIDNTKSIISFDPNFAKVYMQEKQKLLRVLKEGDNTLFKIAKNIVQTYIQNKKFIK